MKLSTNNFIKGLNKDVNPEYIDSQMFEDAVNLITEFEGVNGSLVPMRGVERFQFITSWRDSLDNSASGFKVIAVKYVETEDKIYYFLCGDRIGTPGGGEYQDENFILTVDTTGTIEVIMGGYDLGFYHGYEYHIDYISYNEKRFLFWTDNGKSSPKYIDIDIAKNEFSIAAKLGSPTSATNLETFINVCKKPPVSAPIVEYVTSEDTKSNFLLNKFFQFKYRYNYEDGSVSAFSPISKIDAQINGFIGGGDQYYTTYKTSFNNTAKVTMAVMVGIESIDLAYRESNLTEWYFINIGTDATYYFKNDMFGISLGSTALDTKYYDNVPLKALSQTYAEQLLVYGGYTDGYNNVAIDSFTQIDYNQRWSLASRIFAEIQTTASEFWVNLTIANINTIIEVGDFLTVDIYVTTDLGPAAICQFSILRELSDATEFMNEVRRNIETYNGSVQGIGSTLLDFTTSLDAGNGNKLKVTIDGGGEPITWNPDGQRMAFGVRKRQIPSLKSGETPNIGIVYYDQFNRQGAVNVIDDVPIVLETWQQGHNENDKVANAGLRIAINNLAPTWAKAYQFVYSNGNLPKNILDFQVISATDIPAENSWRLSVYNRYVDIDYAVSLFDSSSVILYKYTFSTVNSTDQRFPSQNREIKVKKVYKDGTGSLAIDVSYSDYEYLKGISFNQINLIGVTFQIKSIEKDSNFVYYEIGERFTIDNNQRHSGNVQNQVANDTLIGTITLANIVAITGLYGGLFRATITDATLHSYPNGTPISVYNTTTTITSLGFIMAHGSGSDVIIETQNLVNNSSDHIFTVTNEASSILDIGTVYLSENMGQGAVPLDTDDFYGFKLYSAIESYSPIPVQFQDIGTDTNALKVPVIENNLGRVQIESKHFKQSFRFNSLIGSQIMEADTNFFGLTSFPNTAFSFKDLDAQYGQVTSIIERDTDIVVFQETRCGRVLLFKDILTTAEGSQSLTVSDRVFGQYVPYMGNTGIGKTFQSIQYYKGRIYFQSPNGDVYRLSTDGLTELSELGLKDYFNKSTLVPSFSGIMPQREEYILQSETELAQVFSTVQTHWVSPIGVGPNKMSRLQSELVSFVGTFVLIHERTSNYSELFTTAGGLSNKIPSVTLSANDPKTLTKIYETLEFSGEKLDNLKVTSINTKDATSTNIPSIIRLDSSWVVELPNGSYNETLGNEYVGIGIAQNIVTDTVFFNNPINLSAFQISDILVSWDGNTIINHGSIIETSDNSIKVSGSPSVTYIGDQFMALKPSSIDGSDLRGIYLRMTLEMETINQFFRLNAISTFGTLDEGHEK